MWIVGDEFLDSTYDMFIKMRKDTHKNNKRLPYLYEQYNLTYLMQDQLEGTGDPLANIYNSVVKGLNASCKNFHNSSW